VAFFGENMISIFFLSRVFFFGKTYFQKKMAAPHLFSCDPDMIANFQSYREKNPDCVASLLAQKIPRDKMHKTILGFLWALETAYCIKKRLLSQDTFTAFGVPMNLRWNEKGFLAESWVQRIDCNLVKCFDVVSVGVEKFIQTFNAAFAINSLLFRYHHDGVYGVLEVHYTGFRLNSPELSEYILKNKDQQITIGHVKFKTFSSIEFQFVTSTQDNSLDFLNSKFADLGMK
jgi:hypothetical protein